MKYITREMLERADACPAQLKLFRVTFGTKAKLMESNVTKAVEAGLDFEWLTRLLPQPIWVAFDAQRAPLREAYKARRAALREAYEAQRNTLLLNALLDA